MIASSLRRTSGMWCADSAYALLVKSPIMRSSPTTLPASSIRLTAMVSIRARRWMAVSRAVFETTSSGPPKKRSRTAGSSEASGTGSLNRECSSSAITPRPVPGTTATVASSPVPSMRYSR